MSDAGVDIQARERDAAGMARDVFPLRFKNPHTRAALKLIAEQTGMSITDIAEKAIEHEVALLGADLGGYLEAAAAGERSGLDPARDARAGHAS